MSLPPDLRAFAAEILAAARSDPETPLRDKIALLSILAKLAAADEPDPMAFARGLEYYRDGGKHGADGSGS
ncbi:MAG: hypothetical protein ACREFX_07430 [Opitutaceae bacterium]